MADRVKPVGPPARGSVGTASKPAAAPAAPKPPKPRGRFRRWYGSVPPRLRFGFWLSLGIAVMMTAGYLVAALVFFPAPLLPNEREVTAVIGLSEREAASELEKAGLTATVAGREPSPSPSGRVVWQDPPAGVAVPRGTAVQLFVSGGAPRVTVPDVRGYDTELAMMLLAAAGLRVDGVDSVASTTIPPGIAHSTTPAAGDSVAVGRSIMLHLVRQGI